MNVKTNDVQAVMEPVEKDQNGPDFYTNEYGVLVFTNPAVVKALMNNPTHKSALMALVSVGKAQLPSEVIQ